MTPEQLKLADKIEGWSPEKWKPLTLIAHERRLAVAALRATPDARVKEALELAEKADEIHANCDECGGEGAPEECEFCFPSADDARIARRAALSHQPGTGEAGGVPDRETFWLVERIGHQQYVKDHSELPALTNDPWRAVRFVTEREAHNFWLRLATLRDECKPVEHMFINKGAPSPALDTATVEACAKICERAALRVVREGKPGDSVATFCAQQIRALAAKEGLNG